ncbi:hypothetical protein ACFXAO_37750 [Streptomyces lavendulae]|uniref:hypothetical protein n=1 Tax=Streptomyces lavendulae TaxID=1914 RepID=UPI0036D1DB24
MGIVGGGIQWLVGPDRWQHSVVFARGITPEELGLRMGGRTWIGRFADNGR